jgi:hypothetical protein
MVTKLPLLSVHILICSRSLFGHFTIVFRRKNIAHNNMIPPERAYLGERQHTQQLWRIPRVLWTNAAHFTACRENFIGHFDIIVVSLVNDIDQTAAII